MLASNLDFFLGDVTVNLYYFHSVEKRFGNGSKVIRCSYKENFRQVVVHVKIIVMEVTVLLRIKHFEQCRCRVSLEVFSHFVNFVEYNHGVAAATLAHCFYDAAWHCANVGTTMPSNFGFIMQSSQRDALILAVQGLGNRASKRCFTHSGRAIEAQDWSFEIATQL